MSASDKAFRAACVANPRRRGENILDYCSRVQATLPGHKIKMLLARMLGETLGTSLQLVFVAGGFYLLLNGPRLLRYLGL